MVADFMPSKIASESTQYKRHLNSLVADRKVTTEEAKALVKEAQAPGFTQVREFYLAGFVAKNHDKFEPGAADVVNAALKKANAVIEPEVGLAHIGPNADPNVTPSDARKHTVTYATRPGSVTVNGFNADDPMQGNVGDCYLVSSLASVAQAHPELLEKNLKTNRDGTYTVTFYERADMNGPSKPVSITVDGDFPQTSGMLEYIAARSTKELWPLIYEKAYAVWKGGYGQIESGMGAMALEAITGAKPSYFPITSDADPKQIYAQVKAAIDDKGCVVALSQPFGSDVKGMVDDHAYSVLGAFEKNGQQFVTVRNPWGQQEVGADGKNDGTFTLTAQQFARAFSMIELVKPS